jgi:hypothetical protein
MAQRAFADIGDQLTKSLIAGDFALYQSLMVLPLRISPRGTRPYVLETEAALRSDFDLYHANIRAHGVTDIFRQVLGFAQSASDQAQLRCLTHILVQAHRIVNPFETVFHLRLQGEDWRISEIESSEGHINWSLGQADISAEGSFKPRSQS